MNTYAFATECPACGHEMTNVSGLNTKEKPSPGDATLCIRCGAICTFDEHMAMQLVLDTSGPEWSGCLKARKHIRQINGLPA